MDIGRDYIGPTLFCGIGKYDLECYLYGSLLVLRTLSGECYTIRYGRTAAHHFARITNW
jgi:hypothetical protein